ncbi:MAG: hypothetical protein JST67_04570 [Bacteroidetes bacterium]|nr:hypothetical protein [Bacteroidota bacterium]
MMKKIITLLTVVFSVNAWAQETNKAPELNCYLKWAQKFDERGGDDVADGTYTDVIITIRSGANADCYQGKAVVKNHKVEIFYVMRDDGTYDAVQRVWNSDPKNVTINNGISSALMTKDTQLINIIWPKKLKPKKAGLKKAPEPGDD